MNEQLQLLRQLRIETDDSYECAPSNLKHILRCIESNSVDGVCSLACWEIADEVLLSEDRTRKAIGELRRLGLIESSWRPREKWRIRIQWDRVSHGFVTPANKRIA